MKLSTQMRSRSPISRLIVLAFLLLLVAVAAIPNYLRGKMSWANPPQVANLNRIRNLRVVGLELPNWKTQERHPEVIGGHKWLVQEFETGNQQAIVQLRSQQSHKEQPEVEWMDINGFEQWQRDSARQLNFTIAASENQPSIKVTANYFRAWTQRKTFAVVQWYAWPEGGSPEPSHWFWADQIAQWQRRRLPWIAISLKIPIEPLGDIEKARPIAEHLAQKLQVALMTEFANMTN